MCSVTEPLLQACLTFEDTKGFVFVIQLRQKDFIAKPVDTIIKNTYILHFEATQSWGSEKCSLLLTATFQVSVTSVNTWFGVSDDWVLFMSRGN